MNYFIKIKLILQHFYQILSSFFVKLIQISAEYDFIDENQVKEIVNRDYEFDCHYQMITDQNLHLLKIKIIEHFE